MGFVGFVGFIGFIGFIGLLGSGGPIQFHAMWFSVVTGVDVGECARSAMFSLLAWRFGKASHCEIKLERRHCESLETMPLQICTVRNSW